MSDYERIDAHAKLIAALADRMQDRDWGTNILADCERIERELQEIRRIVQKRLPGER